MRDLSQHDDWLTSDDFAAIVMREPLVPVEGPGGVFFPATYAAAEDKNVFPGGYNIDPPTGEKNVCLVDSVGSQANRIEPLFAKPGYAELVPQIVIQAGERSRWRCDRPLHAASEETAGRFQSNSSRHRTGHGQDRPNISSLWSVGFP